MMIDISNLTNNKETSIDLNELINFDTTYLDNTDIRSIKPVKVTGTIFQNDGEQFNLNLNIKGEMILPCSITLEDVTYPFDINYESDIDEETDNLKIIGNYVDIIPIVWENIVTEIPLRVVSPNAKLEDIKSDGFKIITEETPKNNQFAELKNLLKEKEDE